jgi:hypothetical protein
VNESALIDMRRRVGSPVHAMRACDTSHRTLRGIPCGAPRQRATGVELLTRGGRERAWRDPR